MRWKKNAIVILARSGSTALVLPVIERCIEEKKKIAKYASSMEILFFGIILIIWKNRKIMDEADKKKIQSLIYQRYQEDWVFMVEHGLRHGTWSKQREIIRAVQNYPRVAVQAAHGCSKTYTAAEIVVVFYNLFPHCRIITTAPIFDQVEKLLWREVKEIYLNSPIELKGICYQGKNTCEIKDQKNPKHFAFGFSTDKPARAEGHHEYDIMFIFDEAKGIPGWMWDSARGALGEGNTKWLVLSTTDGVDIGSPFYECFQGGSDWHQIHISAFDTPYYQGQGDFLGYEKEELPKPKGEKFRILEFPVENDITRFQRKYIEPKDYKAQINGDNYVNLALKDWGKKSYHFDTKVLGKIIESDTDGIVLIDSVREMFDNFQNRDFDDSGTLRAGIDVAWGGDNKTVCFKAKGMKVIDHPLVINSKKMTEEEMTRVQCDRIERYLGVQHKKEYDVRVDVASFGISIAGELKKRGWKVLGVNNRTNSNNKKYEYIIDEMWFEIAKDLHKFACPKIPELKAQLIQRKKWVHEKGFDKVERKDDYIKRGFKSPDFVDAFMLCVYRFPKRPAFGQSKLNIHEFINRRDYGQ